LVSRNAYRAGITAQLREIRQAMRQQLATLKALG
jgi:hypothetical protein